MKTPNYQKRHYEEIATILGATHAATNTIELFVFVLSNDNPRFKEDEFRKKIKEEWIGD